MLTREMRIRYPEVTEFKCEWLADILRTNPNQSHRELVIRSIRRNRYDRGQARNRRGLFEAEVDQLVEAIRNSGEFNAILVARHVNGNWVCIDGHHRLAAWKQLGNTKIPCVALDYRSYGSDKKTA